ncbi:Subtilase family protein [Chitinophaga sp. YR573]|uniref:S8 family serine peptidase n=1 Tax=Chitinophaga sp. YR573 TaxID=1881040 RepID=UPI0008D791EE|nr:S8 family serine peptidase [Chitinophaga sp. YR573]SEW04697.1 Subtilase family protein [Chitinophaga sp. YR573]
MKNRVIPSIVFLFIIQISFAQKRGWQNLDLQKDTVLGISLEKAYDILLKNKQPKMVIVAVIDSGIDTLHQDLKSVLWRNPENGYHGENYLAEERGREDITNLASLRKDFYDSLSYEIVPDIYRNDYQTHRKLEEGFRAHVEGMRSFMTELESSSNILNLIVERIGKKNPTLFDFQNYKSQNNEEKQLISLIIRILPQYPDFNTFKNAELDLLVRRAQEHLLIGLNLKSLPGKYEMLQTDGNIQYDPLGLVAPPNFTPFHGTHVAGIIGASRFNGIGVDGVANNVQIMMLKVTSNIRELRDHNLANAIRFATDKGASIINLSFGKPYSWNKKEVDDAVKYAMKNDVLIIHAAGNAGEDLDQIPHFPNPIYADSTGIAKAWIEVGASGPKDDSTLLASFSNYGENSVDILAPGVHIYSTIPGNKYDDYNGSSMAAPLVAGVAALIKEYYPVLTAVQIKEIILKSVVKIKHNVVVKRGGQYASVPFSTICSSSGILNAYNALQLASIMSKDSL